MIASRWIRTASGVALVVGGLSLAGDPVSAWSAELSSSVSCDEDVGVQIAEFTLHNPEAEPLTIVASTNSVFVVGATVAPGAHLTGSLQRDGDFAGTISETVDVEWSSDGPFQVSATATFPGNCVTLVPTTPSTADVAPDVEIRDDVDVAGASASRDSALSSAVLGTTLTSTSPRFTG